MRLINTDSVVSSKFMFYSRTTGDQLTVSGIFLDDLGTIDKITVISHGMTVEYNSNEFVYTNLILDVPGLGIAVCGDKLLIKHPRKKLEEYVES